MSGFDAERARAAVAGSRFASVRHVVSTGSTNADLLSAARRGEPEQVLLADFQSAGRGRLDHRWDAEAGSSLLVSVLVRPEPALARRPELISVAFGLAALDSVRAAGATAIGLKWPNDLVTANGLKLGGVLLESIVGPAGIEAVVAGLGCNLDWSGSLPDGAVQLADLSASTDRTDLLAGLLVGFAARLEQAPAAARADYRRACLTLGSWVRLDVNGTPLVGEAVDLDDRGALVVQGADGVRHTVAAADVEHVRPAR